MPISQISALQLQQRIQDQDQPQPLLVDVREADEFAYARIPGSLHIPLRQLPEQLEQLDAEREIVLICHHGVRSQQACMFLEQYGYQHLFNLQGGIDAWSLRCDPTVKRY